MKKQLYSMETSTYRRIRKSFKGIKNETVAEYFKRLSKYLENNKISSNWDLYESEKNIRR